MPRPLLPVMSSLPAPEPRPQTVRGACEEFESLFLALLMREMRSTVPRNGLFSAGVAGDIFDSLWIQEISRAASRSSPLRIADTLVAALSGEKLKGRLGSTEEIVRRPPKGVSGSGGGRDHEDQ